MIAHRRELQVQRRGRDRGVLKVTNHLESRSNFRGLLTAATRFAVPALIGYHDRNMSVQVILQFPDDAFSALRRSPAEFADELKHAAVCKWYELGAISQSKAAELLGVSRARLLELLSAYRVSPIQTTPEELRAELERG